MSRNNLIQFRKGTLAQFNSVNPTLASGEPGFAIDANVLKVGDGVTPWSGLLGFSVGSGISSINSLSAAALLINGGHNIEVTTNGTEIINIAYTGLEHIVTDSISNVNNSSNTFVQDLLFDQFGHVTGVVSVAVTGIGSGGSVPSNVLVSGDNISFLTNDADYDTIPKYNLTAAGSSAYLFNGPGLSASSSNPTLYFHRGHTYKFVNNMGAHPFQFQTTAGLGGTAYTGGITGSPVSNGTLTWEVRHDTPSVLYYQCTAHASMQGVVYILATGTGSSVPNNVIVSGDNISLLTNNVGYATTGELAFVSGHLQTQIDSIPSATNTFVSGVVYHTGTRNLVLTRNDGVLLTGDFSSVLHSGDNISLLRNDVPYITGFNETDPIFTSSIAYNITATQTGQWSEAYSWQDHATFGYATTGDLSAVSGHLQSQIDAIPSGSNTFVSNIVYNTGNREIVLSRNDGVALTGDLSVILQSGDNISLLNNDAGYITSFTETISSGDPVSFLINDVPYAISGSHINVSGATNNYFLETEPNNTFIHDLFFDQYGHVTGVILAQASGFLNEDAFVTGVFFDSSRNLNLLLGGGAGSLSVNIPASGSTGHPAIDAISNVDNSGNVFIQDLLFDTYGHVTGVVSVAVTGTSSTDSAQLIAVSGHLQSQIDTFTDNNTFVSGISYSTAEKDLVLTRNDGVKLTGDFSSVLHSGDNISLLVNNVPYAISGSHISVSGATDNYFLETEPNNTFVHDLMFDTFGHVTGVILAQASGFLNDDAFVTGVFFDSDRNLNLLLGGGAGSLSVNIPSSGSSSHPSIDAATNVDNSGNIFIQDLLFDGFGHVTGVVSIGVTGIDSVPSNVLVSGSNISLLTNDVPYITGFTETDPIFAGSVAYNITAVQTGQWSDAYSWGDHSQAGYASTGTLISVSGHLQTQINAIPTGHINTDAISSIDNSGNTFIQDLLFDTYGHVTGVLSVAVTGVSSTTTHSKGIVNINNDSTINVAISGGYQVGSLDIFVNGVKLVDGTDFTATDGSGIVFSQSPESGSILEFLSLPASQSISHPTISAASNVDNSGNTFVQDILFDQYGHVTGVVSVAATGITSGASSGGGVLSSSGVNNILVASTGITIVHNTGTSKIQIGTTLNHTALHHFFQ